MEDIISAQGLGKGYKMYPGKLKRLQGWFFPDNQANFDFKWIFRDVSFGIGQGQSLGIVGQNGAGKSTLLKILTGTTLPTEGSVSVKGKVSALLELGMGFHGEFTGRQNVYMSAQLLGHTVAEIDEVMEEIQTFAEINDYFDAPVRTYSSGMQVRLAFSVATAFRPDILIVDEALAVGDSYFQHKCYARIRKFREEGTTLLFVSHDPGAVRTLCDRAILIGDGTLLMDGKPSDVLDYYNARIAEKEQQTVVLNKQPDGRYHVRSGTGEARVERVELSSAGKPCDIVEVGAPLRIQLTLNLAQSIANMTIGLMIKDRLGNEVFGTNTWNLGCPAMSFSAGRSTFCFDISSLHLGVGSYSITLALHDEATHITSNYDWWDHAAVFQVINPSQPEFVGICSLDVVARFEPVIESNA